MSIFSRVVLEGLLAVNGMAAFDDVLSLGEVEKIHHYIRARAYEDRAVVLGNKESARLTWLSNK